MKTKKNNNNILSRKVKKKAICMIAGAGIPLLFFIILFCTIMAPIFSMGSNTYDNYYGAENAGGIIMKLNGRGIFDAPIRGQSLIITSGFGMRKNPVSGETKEHEGIDLACDQGTNVYAVGNGTVTYAGSSEGYGNLVIIKHKDGYETYYGHLSSISVKVGDSVGEDTKNIIIGLSGGTPGTDGAGSSTGPHLHFEVRKDGTPEDPAKTLGLVSDGMDVLAKDLQYDEDMVDSGFESRVAEYLNKKNSVLAEPEYLQAIFDAAKQYGVNPLLLFAITGQEQSFVPKTDSSAEMIANNPFNVYGAWFQYNTNIRDTAAIAAGTVINLSRGRPENAQPIQWINTRGGQGGYAEDENWWKGVTRFFNELRHDVEGYQGNMEVIN